MILAATWVITAYASGCGASGLTKAGTTPVSGHAIAADPKVLPIGSLVYIEGMGERQVHDIGSGVKGRHLDIFMDSCKEAVSFGRQLLEVRVLHVPSRERRSDRESTARPVQRDRACPVADIHGAVPTEPVAGRGARGCLRNSRGAGSFPAISPGVVQGPRAGSVGAK